jgi:hypothetical protein
VGGAAVKTDGCTLALALAGIALLAVFFLALYVVSRP